MTKEQLWEAIGELDDALIEEAERVAGDKVMGLSEDAGVSAAAVAAGTEAADAEAAEAEAAEAAEKKSNVRKFPRPARIAAWVGVAAMLAIAVIVIPSAFLNLGKNSATTSSAGADGVDAPETALQETALQEAALPEEPKAEEAVTNEAALTEGVTEEVADAEATASDENEGASASGTDADAADDSDDLLDDVSQATIEMTEDVTTTGVPQSMSVDGETYSFRAEVSQDEEGLTIAMEPLGTMPEEAGSLAECDVYEVISEENMLAVYKNGSWYLYEGSK